MQIRYIEVDKYVAAPYNAGLDGAVPPPAKRYTANAQVLNDDGSKPSAPVDVYLGDHKERGRIQYWATVDTQKGPELQNVTDTVDSGGALKTDENGNLEFFVAVSNRQITTYPGCIFDLVASPTTDFDTDGVTQTLTCCYSTYDDVKNVADSNLEPLTMQVNGEHQVEIPHWNEMSYSGTAKIERLQDGYLASDTIQIIVNGQRLDNLSYHYGDLLNGVQIPYDMMVLGNGLEKNNCMFYLINASGAMGCSLPWAFPIQGVPLLMPDPSSQSRLPMPGWYGSKPTPFYPPPNQPMTLDQLYESKDDPGFDVVVQFDDDVQPGDVYEVYIYQNGYKDGVPHTLLLGDGKPIGTLDWKNVMQVIAPKGAKPGGTGTVNANIKASLGFSQLDPLDPGYLWVNYQKNGGDWSAVYPAISNPARINFADKDPGPGGNEEQNGDPAQDPKE